MKKANIVIFDFDGTLSAKDSNMQFYKYCLRHSVRPWIYLPLTLVGIILKILFSHGAHVTKFECFWREISRMYLTPKMVKKLSHNFIKQHKYERFGWAAEQVEKEKKTGNITLCISASADYLIPKLVNDMKFDAVIASEMYPNHPWRYKFLCWGDNKIVALNNWAKKNKITPNIVRFYSDNASDRPLMNMANEQIWINPKTGTRI